MEYNIIIWQIISFSNELVKCLEITLAIPTSAVSKEDHYK